MPQTRCLRATTSMLPPSAIARPRDSCRLPTVSDVSDPGKTSRNGAACAPACSAMTRAERYANMFGVVVPFLGLLAAIVLLWNQWVDGTDLAIMVVTYTLFGF